ncbi:hypothetical protein GW17_00053446, partial [Ensete ventricosum]
SRHRRPFFLSSLLPVAAANRRPHAIDFPISPIAVAVSTPLPLLPRCLLCFSLLSLA